MHKGYVAPSFEGDMYLRLRILKKRLVERNFEGDLSQNLTLGIVDKLKKVLRESVSKSNSEYSR